jgi:transglycosylase family protein
MNIKKAIITASVTAGALAMITPGAHAVDTATWDSLAQCESGGNWNINTGNGFYGGVQFTQQSWNGVGMSGSPASASKAEQIEAAERLLAQQGWGAWPACSSKLGLSGQATPTYTQPQSQVQSTPAPVAQPQAQAPAAQPVTPVVQEQPPVEAPAYTQVQETTPAVQQPVASAPVTQPAEPVQATPTSPSTVTPSAPAVSTAGTPYTVKAGDTLALIAQRQGVSGGWEAIYQANQGTISNPNLIFPGQVITLPA